MCVSRLTVRSKIFCSKHLGRTNFACNSYNDATVAIGCSIDYIAPAQLGDTLTARCTEQSRSGRTGNYDVRIENQQGQLIALFHGKSYKVRGPVLTQENPNE